MGRLETLANVIRIRAMERGKYQHKLSKGLVLTVQFDRTTDEWTLSMTRLDVPPSQREVDICWSAFKAPPDAEKETDEKDGWHIVRIKWLDQYAEQTALPGFEKSGVKRLSSYYDR